MACLKKIIFFDFDGVLCDSAKETFVSSWIAYYRLWHKKEPDFIPLKLYSGYLGLRPFLRESEDNVLIQQILCENKKIFSQKEFDQEIARQGNGVMAEFKKLFEKARRILLEEDRITWLKLCPLYPFIRQNKQIIFNRENIYILSTKKPEFIEEILKAEAVEFKRSQIIYAANSKKLSQITQFLNCSSGTEAYFIDDQLEHLKNNSDSRIHLFLPTWGYVRAEWLKRSDDIKVLTAEELIALLQTV